MPAIAIITVVYNNYSDLEDYLVSFKKQTDKDFHVYIVDLSTKPQEVELPEWVTLFREENNGYAYGLVKGYEKAVEDAHTQFVYMNNDTTVAKDFVKSAKKSLKKHPKSLIGGKIYYHKGFEYHTDRYKKSERGKVLWYAGGEMDWDNAFGVHRGVNEVDTGQFDSVEETEFVTGCLMVFDRTLVEKAGNMDVSYFLYYEDTDWSAQVAQAGCKLVYDPNIVIWHKNAQSTGGSGSKLHEKYQRRNRLKFGLRYAPWRTKMHLMWNFVRGR